MGFRIQGIGLRVRDLDLRFREGHLGRVATLSRALHCVRLEGFEFKIDVQTLGCEE